MSHEQKGQLSLNGQLKAARELATIEYAEGKHSQHGKRLNIARGLTRVTGIISTSVGMIAYVMRPLAERFADDAGIDYGGAISDTGKMHLFAAGAALAGLSHVINSFRKASDVNTATLGVMADTRRSLLEEHQTSLNNIHGQTEAGIADARLKMLSPAGGATYVPESMRHEFLQVRSMVNQAS